MSDEGTSYKLIALIEEALAHTGNVDDAHKFMALRGHELSRENIEELARAVKSNRKSQGILKQVRQLVAKRAPKER